MNICTRLFFTILSRFCSPFTATVCGHKHGGYARFEGNNRWWVPRKAEYCPTCLNGMTVPCCTCSATLHLDSPVIARKVPEGINKDLIIKVITGEGSDGQPEVADGIVHCVGGSCGEIFSRNGFLIPGPDGKPRVALRESPIQMMMRTERPVIVHDVTDPRETPTVCEGAE